MTLDGRIVDCRQRVAETAIAAPRRNHTLPLADGHIDGGQGPRRSNRGGDDGAGRQIALDRQVGTEAQDGRLQDHAKHLGKAAKRPGDAVGLGLERQMLGIDLVEARDRAAAESPSRG